MALFTTKGSDNIPQGAVRVTEEEALDYQKAIIRDWKKGSDVFFLRYSKHLSTALVLATTIPTWSYFREILKLPNSSKLIMTFSGTLLPVACSMAIFDHIVTDKVLLMKNTCPMCQILPMGLFNCYLGVIHPALIGLSTGLVPTPKIPNMPDSRTQTKEYFKFIYQKIVKPGVLKFYLLGSLHILSVAFVSYMQTKEVSNLMTELEHESELHYSI